MQLQGRWSVPWPVTLFLVPAIVVSGCASPGAPRPPSLQLPAPVSDLAAVRSGDTVQLRFTVPSRTTDGLPLHPGPLEGTLCRQTVPGGPCQAVAPALGGAKLAVSAHHAAGRAALWTDTLPAMLANGKARPIAYQVEIRSATGKSAGFSQPVYVAAGAAPPPVTDFQAQGARLGVLLRWTPAADAGEVLLERKQLYPPPAPPQAVSRSSTALRPASKAASSGGRLETNGDVWLQADPGNRGSRQTMDGTVVEGVEYSYAAVRRVTVQAGGRSLELRSAPSVPVNITWRDTYPPPTPQGLTAIGFAVPPA